MSVDAEYLPSAAGQKQVCYQCIKEPFLSAYIKDSGQRASCSYCRRVRESVRIPEIADTFEAAFQRHYYRTPAEMSDSDYEIEGRTGEPWERDGEPILDLLQHTARITAEIAEDIRRELNDRQESHQDQESEFDRDSYYAEKAIGLGAFRDEWTAFEDRLQSQSRYFSRAASTTLATVFQGLRALQTHEGSRVICEAGPGTNLEAMYRARVFQTDHKLREALKRPDLELAHVCVFAS